VQIPSPSRDRRNAQPLRCSLASLPLSQALPVFHSSSSSSVAHSSSIKPAPLVRLLLDIPEVKHLHPSVTSTQQSRCTHRFRISPLHLAITAHPTTASPLACSWTVSVSCRLLHTSLSRLVRLFVHTTHEATHRITIIEQRWKLRCRKLQSTTSLPHPKNHACYQKYSSGQAGQDRAIS
jgi:hypothetical protein